MSDVDTKAAEKEEEVKNSGDEQTSDNDSLKEFEKDMKDIVREDYIDEEDIEEDDSKDEPLPEQSSDEEDELDDEPEDTEVTEDETESVPDELVERAVKAGMKLKDVNNIQDNDTLESIVNSLEEGSTPAEDSEGDDVPEEDGSEDEPSLDEVFDLDDTLYDEEIVEKFGKMKELVKGLIESDKEQRGIIEDLRKTNSPENSFINSKIAELSDEYTDLFGEVGSMDSSQKEARERVSEYYGFVTENAEQRGEEISQDEAFKRALSGAFSDKVTKTKGKKLAETAKKRAKKAMNAPRDSKGRFKPQGEEAESGDPADVALQKLNEKYG